MKKEDVKKELTALRDGVVRLIDAYDNTAGFEADKFEPKPETAFQGMVREFVCSLWILPRYRNPDEYTWAKLESDWGWGSTLEALRTIYNATLDLAKEQTCNCHFCLQAGNASLRIEALKEPTP